MPGTPGSDGQPGTKGDRGSDGPPGSQGPQGLNGGGVTYIRWGKTTSPNIHGTSNSLVYDGYTAGTHYTESAAGGGANLICLPNVPQYHNEANAANTGDSNLHSEFGFNAWPNITQSVYSLYVRGLFVYK